MNALAISDVLGCSPSGAVALLARAGAELERASYADRAQTADRLREIFEAKLTKLPSSVSAQGSVNPWRRRAIFLIALASAAGAGALVIPRLLDEPTPRAESVKPPEFDLPQPDRLRLTGGFPRLGRKIDIAGGSVSGVAAWTLQAYRAEGDNICFELRAGRSYGDRHCVASTLTEAHAFASPDLTHGLTFVYGNVAAEVERIELVEKGASKRPFEIVDVPTGLRAGPAKFFAGFIAGYLLPMASPEAADAAGYQLADLSLLGSANAGQPLVRYELLLARQHL
jgi:hypothetical protein